MMKRLILFLVIVFSAVFSLDARDIYLFAVGVSDYPGTVNDLRYPDKDAKAMVRLYRTQGNGHTYLLTDQNATRATILENARKLFNVPFCTSSCIGIIYEYVPLLYFA